MNAKAQIETPDCPGADAGWKGSESTGSGKGNGNGSTALGFVSAAVLGFVAFLF